MQNVWIHLGKLLWGLVNRLKTGFDIDVEILYIKNGFRDFDLKIKFTYHSSPLTNMVTIDESRCGIMEHSYNPMTRKLRKGAGHNFQARQGYILKASLIKKYIDKINR